MSPQRKNWYAEIAVTILVTVLVILCVLLVRQYKMAARQGIVSVERVHFADIIRHHQLGAADASLIEPWMTFDYVGVSFKVPTSYITAELGISSSTAGYPNITIGRYSRIMATSSAALTVEVQNAVRDYLAGK